MKLEIDIPKHQYNNIMALDSISLGRVPYKGIIMYAINAIKHGKVLEQEPRWIPVSERLPKKNVEVLATTIWGAVTIAEMFSANDWLIHEGATNAGADDIVAWMPLPKPYNEVEE